MVRGEQHFTRAQYAFKSVVSGFSGCRLQATSGGLHVSMSNSERYRQGVAVPLAEIGPAVGLWVKAMIHVDGRDRRRIAL